MLQQIEETAPNHKAKVTSELEEEILKIENEIKGTDSDMKQLNEKIVQGFRAVVDLDGLSHRLF